MVVVVAAACIAVEKDHTESRRNEEISGAV